MLASFIAIVLGCGIGGVSAPTTASITGETRDTGVCSPPVGGPNHTCSEGTPEGEWELDPTCGAAGADDFNGGCNASEPVFSSIACGQTICGTVSISNPGPIVTRDTDWYEVEVSQNTLLTVRATAEFDVIFGIITSRGTGLCSERPPFPDFWAAGGYVYAACNDPASSPGGYTDPAELELCVGPGKWWVFVAAQWDQTPLDCLDYVVSLGCQPCQVACCVGDDICVETSATDCVYELAEGALSGETTCEPGLCTYGCHDPTFLNAPGTWDIDNTMGDSAANPPMSCATGDSVGVQWFEFQAFERWLMVSTCDSTQADDSVFALYQGSCDATLTEIACSEDGDCGPDNDLGRVCYGPATVGETYLLQLAAWDAESQGIYQLKIGPCPSNDLGACCLPQNVCTVATPEACNGLGGTFIGVQTSCSTPGICELGACCLSDGSCFQAEEAICASLDGLWAYGTPCSADLCRGACCRLFLGSYVCQDVFGDACTGTNATWYPDFDCDDAGFHCEPFCEVVAARSYRQHGTAGELHVELPVSGGIESRPGGVERIELDLDTAAHFDGGVTIDCGALWTGDPATSLADATLTLEFAPPIPDRAVCSISLDCDAEFCLRVLVGDLNASGLVSTADLSAVKPHFGQTAADHNARFDADLNGVITTSDSAQLKTRLGNSIPSCP